MDAKIIIENLLSAIESGDKDDIEETVTLAKLMLPGLSTSPALDPAKLSILVNEDTSEYHVFDDPDEADAQAQVLNSNGVSAFATSVAPFALPIAATQQVAGVPVGPQQGNANCTSCNGTIDLHGYCMNAACSDSSVHYPPGSVPAAAPMAAFCPDCGQQEDANGDCPNPGCSRNTYIPPGYVKSVGKHRPGSGLANKSLYSGGSGSNDTGVLR